MWKQHRIITGCAHSANVPQAPEPGSEGETSFVTVSTSGGTAKAAVKQAVKAARFKV